MRPFRRAGRPARLATLAAGLLLSTVWGREARSLENGLPAYPIGVETLYPAAFPPVPGLFINFYTLQYSIDNVRDAEGRKVFTRFDGDVTASAVRPFVVWDAEILGARPVTFVTLPVLYRHVSAAIDADTPAGPLTVFQGSQNRTGFGDVSVAALLAWNRPGGLSYTAGFETFLPTGDYRAREDFNIGVTNTYTFYPQASVTWRPPGNHHASLKLMYGIPLRNGSTDYRSGQHLIAEAAAGVGVTDTVGLDLTGYALVQTTDDNAPGRSFANGNRTRLFGVGPQLRVNVGPGALSVSYQREFGARNAPEGHRFFFRIGLPLYVPNPPAAAR
ncbi:transporter [Roseomonas sp. CCTCC AB2023176]|uniref:SphA family protein n=1 Tax=Roseomonas sp. CCTCC AB2023176 TaxID=3342640 RepID=UPI0035D8D068